jgi:hypothetical protein
MLQAAVRLIYRPEKDPERRPLATAISTFERNTVPLFLSDPMSGDFA